MAEEGRRRFDLHDVLDIVALIVAILSLFISYRSLNLQQEVDLRVKQVDLRVKDVERFTAGAQLVITSPGDGGSVGLTEVIQGTTPYPNMRHYIIVTPLEVGGDWVQDGIVTISGAGTWTARAQFGTGDVGVGKRFMIRVMATNSIVDRPKLRGQPPDAVFSQPITVVRTQ